MANIIEYVRTNTDSFSERPLNRVDSLVLSWIAYMRIPEDNEQSHSLGGITIAELAKASSILSLVAPLHDPEQSEELLCACAESPRFSDVRVILALTRESKEQEQQFAAMTFALPNEQYYVGYRGTDNTLIGWKEDFNMAFSPSVPAQVSAQAYLELVLQQVEGSIYLGGHSKGGNLAVYATMMTSDEVRSRIIRCFNHDGPGFTTETTSSSQWSAHYELVDKTVPEESIIGLVFDQQESVCSIVKSTNPGIMQHAPFSWVVNTTDFDVESSITYDAYKINKRLNAWLKNMTVQDRERFIEILFKLVQASGEVTFSGLKNSLYDGSLKMMLKRLGDMTDGDRSFFIDAVSDLVATMLLGPAPTKAETPQEKLQEANEKMDDITARFNDRMNKWEKYLGED